MACWPQSPHRVHVVPLSFRFHHSTFIRHKTISLFESTRGLRSTAAIDRCRPPPRAIRHLQLSADITETEIEAVPIDIQQD